MPKFTIAPFLSVNIKRRREALGVSQSELAMSCGLQAAVISHYEHGHREPSLHALIRLASRLRCSVSDLLGETHAPIPIKCAACGGLGVCLPNVNISGPQAPLHGPVGPNNNQGDKP